MIVAPLLNNERELLLLMAEDDQKAFRRLFDFYWQKIYTVAFTLTKSPELSEEIVQDVFLKVWIKREQVSTVIKFGDFLFVIARNHIYNQLRKKTVEQSFVEHLEQDFLDNSVLSEQSVLLKETKQLIERAVVRLPPQQRAVYKLSRIEDADYNTIALRLGISRSTVKNHMTKALQFLRQYLITHRVEFVLAAIIMLCCHKF